LYGFFDIKRVKYNRLSADVFKKEKLSEQLSDDYLILTHWSSVKEFSCLKAIDFAPEACLKFWRFYKKSIHCSNPQHIKIFDNHCEN
jgi:hypothetical protein